MLQKSTGIVDEHGNAMPVVPAFQVDLVDLAADRCLHVLLVADLDRFDLAVRSYQYALLNHVKSRFHAEPGMSRAGLDWERERKATRPPPSLSSLLRREREGGVLEGWGGVERSDQVLHSRLELNHVQ